MSTIISGLEIKKLFTESEDIFKDIIVTIPSNIDWSEYQKELDEVKDYKSTMYFKVNRLPVKTKIGKKCYLCYKGEIIGWMEIVELCSKDFTCTTTGKNWNGNFIGRSGPMHYLTNKIKTKGFQGFRYV